MDCTTPKPCGNKPESPFLKGKVTPAEEFRRINEYYPLIASSGCSREFCQSGRMIHTDEERVGRNRPLEEIEREAVDFLMQLRRDSIIGSDSALHLRTGEVLAEIRRSSAAPNTPSHLNIGPVPEPWHQTFEELQHGLRLAWKHSRKCIMRSEFDSLRYEQLSQLFRQIVFISAAKRAWQARRFASCQDQQRYG